MQLYQMWDNGKQPSSGKESALGWEETIFLPADNEGGDRDDKEDPQDNPHYDGGEGQRGQVQDT